MNPVARFFCFFRDQSGVSAVEFALILPILFFIFLATVDVGYYIKERMQLQNAAQAAAEYVAQTGDDANVQTVAREAYVGNFSTVNMTSEFSCECSDGVVQACPLDCDAGDYQRRFIAVTAERNYEPLFLYPLTSQNAEVRGSVRVRVD